jgi:hypothetical protein
MEGARRPRQASLVANHYSLHQSWPMEPEGACHLRHYGNVCLERCCQHHRLHCPEAILRPAVERIHHRAQHHIHWSVWLRHLRNPSSHLRVARRVGLLEQSSHRQDSAGSSLAGSQELQAPTRVLVQLCRHVCVRILPRLHLPLAQFRVHPLLGFHERHR